MRVRGWTLTILAIGAAALAYALVGRPAPEPAEPTVAAPVLLEPVKPSELPPLAPMPAPDLEDAWAELDRLETALKRSRSINEELVAALDAVSHFYHSDEWGEASRRRAKFRKKAEKAFLKAFTLTKVHRQTGLNIRDDVNVRAAALLGDTGNAKLSGKIIRTIETRLQRAKHHVSTVLWEQAFGALAKLNDPRAFEWMIDEYTHTRSSPSRVVDELAAAHMALARFRDPPGRLRYELVREMIKAYLDVEKASWNARSAEARRRKIFWDRIGPGVIAALRSAVGQKTDARGRPFSTVRYFQLWFRAHKNPRRPPWTKGA